MRMSVLIAALSVVAGQSPWPTPPVQTEAQKALFAKKQAAAKEASEAATPKVLEFFDLPAFREGLAECCPDAAQLSSAELLEQFRAEVRAAELAHAFPSTDATQKDDTNIGLQKQYPWFLNLWQAALINLGEVDSALYPAETDLFGCTPFATGTVTWEEASDRLVYIAHNLRQLDLGSILEYGDVDVIFSSGYARDMVLITPVDSGNYEHFYMHYNKSYWDPPVLGTLDYHDHMILASWGMDTTGFDPENSIMEEALGMFRRSAFAGNYSKIPPADTNYFDRYWEANIVGNPRNDGVKFLAGSFKDLFGTATGVELRELCDQNSWPLIWALGDAATGGDGTIQFAGNERVLDPFAVAALNITKPADAADSFTELWQQVVSAREQKEPSASQWVAWWQAYRGSQTRLAPVTARACADVDTCIGTDLMSGDCVCKAASAVQVV